jgi:transmembrane sensor
MRENARREASWRRLRSYGGALAAVFAVVVVLGALVFTGPHLPRPEAEAGLTREQAYSTRLGQISTVSLPDGSTATLDTDSAIIFSQDAERRSLRMVRGRALFKVAKDPEHPFVVAADGRAVTALGTEFEVYLKGQGLEVTLFEGRVRVERPVRTGGAGAAPSVELTPGYKLVAGEGDWSVARAEASASWAQGRLVFDEVRIAEIAAELNRYTADKITVIDPAVGEKRMSAVLGAGDERAFLNAVKVMQLAKVRWAGDRYELTAP